MLFKRLHYYLATFILINLNLNLFAQQSSHTIARQWNHILLEAISNDFARPTVHARNLYHTSAMNYDIWSAFEGKKDFHFLGKTIKGYSIPFEGVPFTMNKLAAQEEAISFANYRLLLHRFQNSPGISYVNILMEDLMMGKGYDIQNTSTDFKNGSSAEFGNWVAEQIIAYGLQDGSNESNNYANQYYQEVNPPIQMEQAGNSNVVDPNRWQAIELSVAFDQAGNPITGPQDHLSPEWGNVNTFSMHDSLSTTLTDTSGNNYKVYNDPGPPALLNVLDTACLSSLYKWNFLMVSIWQSHNTPNDTTIWDISPGNIGNVPTNYPTNIQDHHQFYNYMDGGHANEPGHAINPITNQPYAQNLAKRGDYTRVVAEYWADGLNSETPPGHWFKIMHDVTDSPSFEKKWMGQGPVLDDLAYDVLAHFVLGGLMHDAAISAWSIKGWYDYTRPASALRWMGDQGQCSDPNDLNYNPNGLPIISGYSELVYAGDSLAGSNNENVGKMKLFTWKGHDYINDPEVDIADVGWILSEDFWTYQLPTFVTPPFAGYISGHSTFSSTAANALSLITGSPFFPGGMMEYSFEKDEFLEFEQGPSEIVKLQWATYKDASDQCSLSRIWGGIHPPVDDIPGRIIGDYIGPIGVNFANQFIEKKAPSFISFNASIDSISSQHFYDTLELLFTFDTPMDIAIAPYFKFINQNPLDSNLLDFLDINWIDSTSLLFTFEILNENNSLLEINLEMDSVFDASGLKIKKTIFQKPFFIDTKKPMIQEIICYDTIINTQYIQSGYYFDVVFDESMSNNPLLNFNILSPTFLNNSMIQNAAQSYWISSDTLRMHFDIEDNQDFESAITFELYNAQDFFGNNIDTTTFNNVFIVDTKNPVITDISLNKPALNRHDFGMNKFTVQLTFDKPMETNTLNSLDFITPAQLNNVLWLNTYFSNWLNDTVVHLSFNHNQSHMEVFDIDIAFPNFKDINGNLVLDTLLDVFSIDTERPEVNAVSLSKQLIYDGDEGIGNFSVLIAYSENMDQNSKPFVQFQHPDGLQNSILLNTNHSFWIDDTLFQAVFNINDLNIERNNLSILIVDGKDKSLNNQLFHQDTTSLRLDTKNPKVLSLSANTYNIDENTNTFQNIILFDEKMETNNFPTLLYNGESFPGFMSQNISLSQWVSDDVFIGVYDVVQNSYIQNNVSIYLADAYDEAGNALEFDTLFNYFSVNIAYLSTEDYNIDAQKSHVYPNPLQQGQELTVVSNYAQHESIKVECYDATGRKMNVKIIDQSNQKLILSTQQLSKGSYYLNISTQNKTENFKLIIQ